jgi:hypothetical protein
MQHTNPWRNGPILLIGLFLSVVLLWSAHMLHAHHVLTSYLVDVAGGMTTIVLSIATYDEWERRRERRRYVPPERMGIKRIKEEILQLLYQYAFVLNLRWDHQSEALQIVQRTTADKEFSQPETELHARAAKHIFQEDPKNKAKLFRVSREALKTPELAKQSYRDINELILQTERAIGQVDMAISTYGYSFTPETHTWALDIRERLSQAITGEIPILSIRLAAVSKNADDSLKKTDREGVESLISRLLAVAKKSQTL